MDDAGDPGVSRRVIWLVLAACGVCYLGLSFEAWGWPAIDGYPTIERFLHPGFLSGDFYTNTSRGYGVDTLQAWLFGGFERLTGVRYDLQLAVVNAIRCLAFPALVYGFFLAVSDSAVVALCGVVLGTLANFALPKTLGWAWVWGDSSTAMLAIVAVIGGWTLLLRRRVWPALLCFAFATAMHPLTAVHGGIVAGLIVLVDYSGGERRTALRAPATLGSAGLLATVFLAQLALLSPPRAERLPLPEYLNILAYERHPGDFLPSQFSLSAIVTFLLAAAAVLMILIRRRTTLPRYRLLIAGLGSYALICVGGYLFVEVWPIRGFVELIPYRTANIGAPFMLLVLATVAAEALTSGRRVLLAALAAAFILASPYATHELGHDDTVRLAAAGLLFLTVLLGLRADEANPGARAPGPILGLATAALVAIGAVGASSRREAFRLPTPANQHAVYRWARDSTPGDATFLVEQFPGNGRFGRAINPQKMRLVGHRAVVASLDFPFLDRDMRPWFERWKIVLAGRTPDRIEQAGVDTLDAIRHRFPYEYVIRRTRLPADGRIALVAAFGPEAGIDTVLVYRMLGGLTPAQAAH